MSHLAYNRKNRKGCDLMIPIGETLADGIEISVNARKQSDRLREDHIHDFHELYYLDEGSARYFIDGETLTLPCLAQKFAMSPSYFSKTFKAHTGFGVCEYITLTRITRAESLLREGRYTVTQVSAKCGYNDSSYFAAVFKRKKGVSPHKYAVMHRSEGPNSSSVSAQSDL